MKNQRLVLVILLIGIYGYTLRSVYAKCPTWREELVEIPTVFEFKNERFRDDWVYRSLEPKLKMPDAKHPALPSSSVVHEGRIEFTFCITGNEVPAPNSKFYAYFGPRQLEVSARPVSWSDVEVVKDGKNVKLRRGKMAIVWFLRQQDPDWAIVRRAQWSVNPEGIPRLDIEVYNFMNGTHPGFDLQLGLYHGGDRCVSSPRAQEISVSFTHSKEKIEVTSGDPQFKELIQRKSRLAIGGCGELDFQTELGTTGGLPPGDALRLRYSFESDIFKKRIERNQDVPIFEKIFSLPERVIHIHGARVFPSRIPIE